MTDIVGPEKARTMRDLSITIYLRAREMAEAKGIIIAVILVSISFPIRSIYLKATPMAVFKRKLTQRSGKQE
jgi:hypothetical protein